MKREFPHRQARDQPHQEESAGRVASAESLKEWSAEVSHTTDLGRFFAPYGFVVEAANPTDLRL